MKLPPLGWVLLIVLLVILFVRCVIPLTVCVAFSLILLGIDSEPAMKLGLVVAAGLTIYTIYRGLRD